MEPDKRDEIPKEKKNAKGETDGLRKNPRDCDRGNGRESIVDGCNIS